ncbi:hypothetical protein ACIPSE_01980 [Streptomyces sp. NPDC090106]|uniref:hypothetical protein n=1 Tax=Streptomyces sp. NPDC090106 TaxID=3365946 RepID=UPI0038086645
MGTSARRALAVCLAATALTGCRVGGDDTVAVARVAKVTCGDLRWGRVDQEQTLIAVSPVVEVGEEDGEVRFPPVRVREVKPRVETSGQGPSAKAVFASLEKHLGPDYEDVLKRPGTSSATSERDNFADSLGASGGFVFASGVRAVDATFATDCDGSTVYGSVSTWYGTSGTSLKCGHDPRSETAEEWVLEAYGLACGGGA